MLIKIGMCGPKHFGYAAPSSELVSVTVIIFQKELTGGDMRLTEVRGACVHDRSVISVSPPQPLRLFPRLPALGKLQVTLERQQVKQ